jgi:hypothetical protein
MLAFRSWLTGMMKDSDQDGAPTSCDLGALGGCWVEFGDGGNPILCHFYQRYGGPVYPIPVQTGETLLSVPKSVG